MPVASAKATTRTPLKLNFEKAGQLVAPNQTQQISRQGTYKQANALPGAGSPKLPTTYKGTGSVEVDIPIKTIDVKAVPIPNKGIEGTPDRSSMAGTRDPRYSLPGRSDRAPLPDLKGLKSPSGRAAGAATFLENLGGFDQRIRDATAAANQQLENDAKYGSGYSGRFVDDFNPVDPEFALDPKAVDRMGYRNYGEAASDAASTIFNGVKDVVQNAANALPKFQNPFAPQPNASNPGQPAPGPEFAEPPAKPKLGLNLPLAPHGPEYQPYPPGGSAAPNSQSNRQNKFSDDPPVRPPGADPKRYPDVPPGDPIAILERPPSPPPIGTPQPLGTAQQYDIKVFPSNAPSLIYYQRRVTGPVTYTRLPNDGTPGPYYTDDNGQVQQSTMYSFSLSWPGGSTVHTGGNTVWSATPVAPPAPGSNPGWQPTPSDPQAWPSTPPAPHIPASPNPSAPPVVGPQPSAQPNATPQGDPQASPKNKPQAPTSPSEPAPNIPPPLGFPMGAPQGLPSPSNSPNLAPSNPLAPKSTPGQSTPTSSPVTSTSLLDGPSTTTSISSSPIPGIKEGPQPREKTDLSPTPSPSPATPDRCKDPCMNRLQDSSDDAKADLEAIKRVLGVKDFPATLPLIAGETSHTINNIPELLVWIVRNTDAVAGMWPAKVKIVRADGTSQEIQLESIGHALEELFAALLIVAEDADAAVNIGARLAVETIQTKISTKQSGEMLEGIIKFLGFSGRPKPQKIKIGFTPTAAGADNKLQNDEMAAFLEPSEQNYVGYENPDKDELLPILKRILQDAEIARAALFHPLKKGPKGESSLTGEYLKTEKKKKNPVAEAELKKLLDTLKKAGFKADVDKKPPK